MTIASLMHEAGTQNRCSGTTQRDRVGGRWEGVQDGKHVHSWLIHVDVWQKPPQYCKVISLQLNKFLKKKNVYIHRFPGGASSKEPACRYRKPKRHRFNPWVGKIPWKRALQPTLVFLIEESHGHRSLAGYSP